LGIDLHILNAREHPELNNYHAQQGFDIDNGMILVLSGQTYYGGEVMHVLNLLSSPDIRFNRLSGLLLARRRCAIIFYPFFKFFRVLSLRMLGIRRINSGD
jgi:hypothetical protein